ALVVDVLLVQRPADALGHAALHLALDIARVDGAADVLHRGVADDAHDAEFGIHFDIADVGAKTALGAFGVELHAGADRPAHLRGLGGKLGRRWGSPDARRRFPISRPRDRSPRFLRRARAKW